MVGTLLLASTFWLGRISDHELEGARKQHVDDRLNILEKYELDHAVTHQANDRDIHGAILVAAQNGDTIKELSFQVKQLTIQVRAGQSQLAEISKLSSRLAVTSTRVEELSKRLDSTEEAVRELTKGLKKRGKEDKGK